MSYSPFMLGLLYAGLAGTVLALIVATATNRWSLRVFFLLALRLTIGWHFLFEGLHKVNTYYAGPIEVNGKMQRPFSSEMYFRVAPGPLGERMRNEFGDPNLEITTKVKAPEAISPSDFAKLSVDDQAAKCPKVVADQLTAVEQQAQQTYKAAAEKSLKAARAAGEKVKNAATDAEGFAANVPFLSEASLATLKDAVQKKYAKAKETAEKDQATAQKNIDSFEAGGKKMVTAAKAAYARWVFGVDARDCKVKGITGDVPLSGAQRIEELEWLRSKVQAAAARETQGLGIGHGTDNKRVADFRMDALAASYDLARDADTFINDLRKDLNGGKAIDVEKPESRGKKMDFYTMWFIVAVGAMLMGGLFTRLVCVLGAGFLVMTYLAHPPFPWFPLPPNTEGNPVFINKNVIEAIALLALATFPTGRWLGLDALVLRPFCRYRGECSKNSPPPTT